MNWKRAVTTAILILLVLRIGTTALRLGFYIPATLDLSFPEGAVVARSLAVARGEPAYTDWREWPHAFAPYGPLTYYSAGWAARFVSNTGVGARSGGVMERPGYRDIYTVGRAISEVSLAGILVLIFALGRGAGLSWRWCVLAVAIFTSWLRMLEFTSSHRPDAPQVFFSLLALWIATRFRPTIRSVPVALLILGVAMFFKPTSWAVALALGGWIGIAHGIRWAALSLIAFGLVGLSIAAALNFHWDGLLFLNMVGSLDNGWKPRNWFGLLRRLPTLPALVLGLGWGASFALSRAGRRAGAPPSILWIACALSPVIALVQYLKVGASINYMLEPNALASVAAAYLAREITTGDFGRRISRNLRGFLLIGGLAILLFDAGTEIWTAPNDLKSERGAWKDLPLTSNVLGKVGGGGRLDGSSAGPVLTSSPYVGLASQGAGQAPLDNFQYMVLFNRGKLSDRALVTRVEERHFSLVVLPGDVPEADGEFPITTPWYSPGFMEALRENYAPIERTGIYVLLEPRM